MKKSLIKNLLERRMPQIIGSYFVGSTTLILFIDWLITKYGFSDNILQFTWFGLISILPSVLIIAYFHGAPGKDEWTRVEKFGIPINILFIAIALFTGYKFNAWQDPPPDHSEVYDIFMVHVSSNQNNIDQLKLSDFWLEDVGVMKYITGGASSYIDSIYPVDNKELDRIRRYVNVNLNKEFMNHEGITINYPDNQKEINMMDNMASVFYFQYLSKEMNDDELQKKKDEELKVEKDRYFENIDYFNNKHDTYIDHLTNVKIYKGSLSTKGKLARPSSFFDKSKEEMYFWSYTMPIMNSKGIYSLEGGLGFYQSDEGEDNIIEDLIYSGILEEIKNKSFGTIIGEVANILDSNLVTIKLNNLELIKGTDLIFLTRKYPVKESANGEESLKRYIKDNKIIYTYLYNHPDQIYKEAYSQQFNYKSTDYWLEREKNIIDSLEANFQTIIDEGVWGLEHENFRYYLRILNIQDSIATAKITGSIFPFAKPMIGDKINIK